MTKKRVVFFIDGWFMCKRSRSVQALQPYDGRTIRDYCRKHLRADQELFRIYYYDSMPLTQKGHNPVSRKPIDFSTTAVHARQTELFNSLRTSPNFALRLGTAKWQANAWRLKTEKLKALLALKLSVDNLKEADVEPVIEQKGVDMRFGLDIATIAYKRIADTIVVITGDQDFVPALKLARKEGLMVGLDTLRANVSPSLLEHVDFSQTFG